MSFNQGSSKLESQLSASGELVTVFDCRPRGFSF